MANSDVKSIDRLIELFNELAARVETLESMLASYMQKKYTISILKDVLDEGLQALEDDEFVEDEEEGEEK